jgi:hypothetical protein
MHMGIISITINVIMCYVSSICKNVLCYRNVKLILIPDIGTHNRIFSSLRLLTFDSISKK